MSDEKENLPQSVPVLGKLKDEEVDEIASIGAIAFQKTLQGVLSGQIKGGIKGIFKAAMDNVTQAEKEFKAIGAAPENKSEETKSIESPKNKEHE